MLSSTPSRQPGEDFRRKVASHWGVSYAQLEALAFGEEPALTPRIAAAARDLPPPNLAKAVAEYQWLDELPTELRSVVCEQARIHYVYTRSDLAADEWQRVLTGLEREAMAIALRRIRAKKRTSLQS
jgi:hypothetical protein